MCHQQHWITRTRLGLSHFLFTKFKYSFQDPLDHVSNCGKVETTIHYLPHLTNFSNERLALFNKLQSINENILIKGNSNIWKVILFGEHAFNDTKNTLLIVTIHTSFQQNVFILSYKKVVTYLFVYVQRFFSAFIKIFFFVHLFLIVLYFFFMFRILFFKLFLEFFSIYIYRFLSQAHFKIMCLMTVNLWLNVWYINKKQLHQPQYFL